MGMAQTHTNFSKIYDTNAMYAHNCIVFLFEGTRSCVILCNGQWIHKGACTAIILIPVMTLYLPLCFFMVFTTISTIVQI